MDFCAGHEVHVNGMMLVSFRKKVKVANGMAAESNIRICVMWFNADSSKKKQQHQRPFRYEEFARLLASTAAAAGDVVASLFGFVLLHPHFVYILHTLCVSCVLRKFRIHIESPSGHILKLRPVQNTNYSFSPTPRRVQLSHFAPKAHTHTHADRTHV